MEVSASPTLKPGGHVRVGKAVGRWRGRRGLVLIGRYTFWSYPSESRKKKVPGNLNDVHVIGSHHRTN